ncbi:GspE/PulE family protein [Fastidiosibacter lacustris]|uniref:GspE/PulE family protein n=1 Tax=Fastidiosibacter lacustris TaxID=2056695 RepID=UPI000E346B1F|nr:ATPase, T2SS/T4P/T4SS family [Fastidiosibacter lacustris]
MSSKYQTVGDIYGNIYQPQSTGAYKHIGSLNELDFSIQKVISESIRKEQYVFAKALKDGRQEIIVAFISTDVPEARYEHIKKQVKSYVKGDIPIVVQPVSPLLLDDVIALASEDEIDTGILSEFYNIVKEAVDNHASDIHIEATATKVELKHRINGLVYLHKEYDADVMLKVLRAIYNTKGHYGTVDKQLDLYNKAQQAVIDQNIAGMVYRLRFQSTPLYPYGYNVVMRVLSMGKKQSQTINSLGYSSQQVELIDKALTAPEGVIIFSGETGSGKSTSLSVVLKLMVDRSRRQKKILTIESPPEYIIDGACQIPVHETADDTSQMTLEKFNHTFKAAMRLDPDVIMAGEIRDRSSAALLQQAVQSGHKVLTTLHAQNAFLCIDRLMGIGIDRDVLLSPKFLSLIVHQTLIPIVCPRCAWSYDKYQSIYPDCQILQRLQNINRYYGNDDHRLADVHFANPDGCIHCDHKAAIGREVVAEILAPTEKILEKINLGKHQQAREIWHQNGGKTISYHAFEKVLSGLLCPVIYEYKMGRLDQLEGVL